MSKYHEMPMYVRSTVNIYRTLFLAHCYFFICLFMGLTSPPWKNVLILLLQGDHPQTVSTKGFLLDCSISTGISTDLMHLPCLSWLVFLLRIIWRAARFERILVFVGHQVFLVVWSWLVKLLLAEFDRSVNWYPIFSLRIIVINGFKYVLIWFGMVDCCILFALFVCHYCIHWIDVSVWVWVCSLLQTAKGITNRSTTLLPANSCHISLFTSQLMVTWFLNQSFGRLLVGFA